MGRIEVSFWSLPPGRNAARDHWAEPQKGQPMGIKTTTIQQTEFIPAKPVQVYDAFINARKHAEFTGARATCHPRLGRTMLLYI